MKFHTYKNKTGYKVALTYVISETEEIETEIVEGGAEFRVPSDKAVEFIAIQVNFTIE